MKAAALLLALAFVAAPADKTKPSITVKASPTVAFSPARVVVTADIKGGPNDSEELDCPSVEWDWGDGTISDQTADCEPVRGGQERDPPALHRRQDLQQLGRFSGRVPDQA